MRTLYGLLALLFSAIPCTSTFAQHTHEYTVTPIQSGEETNEQRASRMTKEQSDACEMMKTSPNTAPFSFWGHRHLEAHCKGWTRQLMEKSQSQCCGGILSGECRITSYNAKTNEALIDGMWCWAGERSLVIIEDMGSFALICAGHPYKINGVPQCPTVYCKGVGGGS